MEEDGMVPNHADLISQREAAKRFRVAPSTLRRRVQRGDLVTYQNPLDDRGMFFRISDLEKLAQPRLAPVRAA